MGLFNVPDDLYPSRNGRIIPNGSSRSIRLQLLTSALFDDEATQATHPFELRVIPEISENLAQTAYRLALYQRVVQSAPAQRTLVDTPRQPGCVWSSS